MDLTKVSKKDIKKFDEVVNKLGDLCQEMSDYAGPKTDKVIHSFIEKGERIIWNEYKMMISLTDEEIYLNELFSSFLKNLRDNIINENNEKDYEMLAILNNSITKINKDMDNLYITITED